MADPERMDAPNQQAVGQPPPWVEGSGGEAGEIAPEQAPERQPGQEGAETPLEPASEPQRSEQDAKAKRDRTAGRKAEK